MFSFIIVLRLSKFSFVVFQDKHMANFNTVSKTVLLTRKCFMLFMLPNNLEFTYNYYTDRILKHEYNLEMLVNLNDLATEENRGLRKRTSLSQAYQ